MARDSDAISFSEQSWWMQEYESVARQMQAPPETKKRRTKMNGSKIIVIVNNGDYGYPSEFDTMEAAQTAAEGLAHKSQADVYILRPVKKISPKRDVVTVDLPLE